ncbi:DUF1028 domain-containing protein [Microbacterium betulae]|uniref:DUF1028 domain-containing protein n=1 Tax=Microbacterium betulae TaxID=2981139 RepID=A0AA97I809_9MICO|nr:DUF1028 domain-containing protein [Microbacterium sp. AB]WOF24030.1 DUF1028 domain-containing protein [Microbacterium sp. AB]
MTFSLAARDPDSGAFGMVLSSSSPAVAARCLHLRPRVGAVASQNVTDPALGPLLLDLLERGATAEEALARAVADEPFPQHRQLTVVDAAGRTAVFSGERALGTPATATGRQAAAAGNLLAGAHVPRAMIDAYEASTAATFEERLLDGFLGAVAAGGEAGPVRSAGLAVVADASWRVTDLRVDDADDPAGELARLVALWLPRKHDYLVRALDPEAAPSYGVPGDL